MAGVQARVCGPNISASTPTSARRDWYQVVPIFPG